MEKYIRYLTDTEKKMYLVSLFTKNIFLNINLNNCFDIHCCHISRAYKTLCATVIVAKIKITNVDSVYSKCYHFNISCISSNFFFLCVLQTRWNDFPALASSRLKNCYA